VLERPGTASGLLITQRSQVQILPPLPKKAWTIRSRPSFCPRVSSPTPAPRSLLRRSLAASSHPPLGAGSSVARLAKAIKSPAQPVGMAIASSAAPPPGRGRGSSVAAWGERPGRLRGQSAWRRSTVRLFECCLAHAIASRAETTFVPASLPCLLLPPGDLGVVSSMPTWSSQPDQGDPELVTGFSLVNARYGRTDFATWLLGTHLLRLED
jgi:hypothetical protein